MGLLDTIKEDIEDITSDSDGFSVSIILTSPTGVVATLPGTRKRHHLGVDLETGREVNSKTASVTISEKFFIDADYPLRNTAGDVDLKDHLVDVGDSNGVVKRFVVDQYLPDETIGLIVITLGAYEQD